MARSIKNIRNYLLQIAVQYKLPYENKCIFELLIEEESLDNETIIELLIHKYKLANIDTITPNITAIDLDKLNEYYKNGYFIFETDDGQKGYVVNNIQLIKDKNLDILKDTQVYLIKRSDLVQILERDFAEPNTHNAINYVEKIASNVSARSIDYLKMITGFCIIFFSSFFLFFNIFNAINSFLYFIQNLLKITLFKQVFFSKEESSKATIIDDNLPIYSILIPLYKEELKVGSILKAMDNMNYPKDKLDIKLIIEADDILTMRALETSNIPPYMQIIKVPYSLPRTKPKALNYAMPYINGEFLTVYDAEDKPDPDQLLKALYAFDKLPDQFVCVQAKLKFYNEKDNLLTQFFSIEYSLWFEYLLKGLSMLDLPVTLGGNSNHFKVDKLKEVGCWDAYNVTEDADLGIRLYLNGYKVHLINSTTQEESPTNILVWIAQRARWIKGFIQTLCTFIQSKKDLKKFNIKKICSVYIFVGLSSYSFMFLPWAMLILTINTNIYIYYMWLITSISYIIYIYSAAYFILIKNKDSIRNFTLIDWVVLIFWPFYFLLHTIASYRAIWEIIASPFKWNKTPHGKTIDELD